MPEPADSPLDPAQPEEQVESVEGVLVDGEPLAEVRRLPVNGEGSGAEIEQRRASVPAVLTAATGGLVLGIAAFVLMRVLRRPSAAGRLRCRRGALLGRNRGPDIQASRSFLVDVHMLKR